VSRITSDGLEQLGYTRVLTFQQLHEIAVFVEQHARDVVLRVVAARVIQKCDEIAR
jgi:hypothetical protein